MLSLESVGFEHFGNPKFVSFSKTFRPKDDSLSFLYLIYAQSQWLFGEVTEVYKDMPIKRGATSYSK